MESLQLACAARLTSTRLVAAARHNSVDNRGKRFSTARSRAILRAMIDAQVAGSVSSLHSSDSAAHIAFEAEATTCASLELNGVPCVHALIVRSASRLSGAGVRIDIDGVDGPSYQHHVEIVDAGGCTAVDTADFMIPTPLLRRGNERESIDLIATLLASDGRELARARHRLVIVPASHWCGVGNRGESIAAFVTPNATVVAQLRSDVARLLQERTGSSALDGYLSNSAERAQRIADACFETLAARAIVYNVLQASFEVTGQKVRTITEVIADRAGNCLDLAVTLAALLESCGLHSIIALGDGHATIGFSTVNASFADAVHEGPSRLRNRLALGELRMIDATACCSGGAFATALAAGERWLAQASESMHVVDIHAARRAGFHPLPEIIDRPRTPRTEDDLDPNGPTGAPPIWEVRQPATLAPTSARALTAQQLRLEQWKKKLLDLTLRNRLLNDRESAGIPLIIEGDQDIAHLEDVLWDETSQRVLARGAMREMTALSLREELDKKWLRSSLDDAELFKRATKAYRDAISSIEETGARALYVAIGFLEYRVEQRPDPVCAPLLLVPIEMRRISRSEGFSVRAVTEDTVANIALAEYLRVTQQLDIGLSDVLTEDNKGVDVLAMLARVRQRARDIPGMTVRSTAKIGIYSFKKMPLFEEMRAREAELVKHPVVSSLLTRSLDATLRMNALIEPDDVDAVAMYETLRLPLSADSSQIAAVCSAASGATFVLQGPPGTGKSQTITNLLCDCLARGKRVLFVAEKAAALEVVSERLAKCGLGTYALDLHADHASKSAFVAQIKATLEELETRAPAGSRQFASVGTAVDHARQRLAASCDALHRALEQTPSVHAAVERRMETADAIASVIAAKLEDRLEGALSSPLRHDTIPNRCASVRALVAAVDALPADVECALADIVPLTFISFEAAEVIARAALVAAPLTQRVQETASELARIVGLPATTTHTAISQMHEFARAIDHESPLAQAFAQIALSPDASQRFDRLSNAIDVGECAHQALCELETRFDHAALELPLAALAGDLRGARGKFIVSRWLIARRVRAALTRVAKVAPKSGSGGDLEALLAEVEFLQRVASACQSASPFMAEFTVMGMRPTAQTTASAYAIDYRAARVAVERARTLARSARSMFPREVATLMVHVPQSIAAQTLAPAVAATGAALESLDRALQPIATRVNPTPSFVHSNASLEEIAARLTRVSNNASPLSVWSAFTVAREQARAQGLIAVADALLARTLPPATAERSTETELLASWIRRSMREDSALADCASNRMDQLRESFAQALNNYARGAASAVATAARARSHELLSRGESDSAMRNAVRVLDELRALTTIRRSIRRVMREGACAIAAIKPIVLASPLSAATLLPPDFPQFDLVIFDEASQIPVWDAACAISRATACVVVGDSKQLPPTNFFAAKESVEDISPGNSDETSSAQAEAQLADALEPLDSLLEEAVASGFAQRSLLWHYRSRDERLIEFSNRKSYGGRLQTFPAAHRTHADLGVEFRHVGGIYDRGKSSTNRIEAQAVVAEIARRLRDDNACTANRSIGVVTFSQAQQTLVQDLLDEALDADATLRARAAEASKLGEGVFVKNLENVQGDERATMIFSICYGPSASGAATHQFGPLNLSGGERRLNVAVTRAREKIIVITSIRANDLDPAKLRAKGAIDLRDYLAYAEFGAAPVMRGLTRNQQEIDVSSIEQRIADALHARGWKVALHVGRSRDYRVSIALASAEKPDVWIFGIEFDGAFHCAAPTVIDREVVRTSVMKSLGWKMIRVSVLDVLRDEAAVVARIDAAARAALTAT